MENIRWNYFRNRVTWNEIGHLEHIEYMGNGEALLSRWIQVSSFSLLCKSIEYL